MPTAPSAMPRSTPARISSICTSSGDAAVPAAGHGPQVGVGEVGDGVLRGAAVEELHVIGEAFPA